MAAVVRPAVVGDADVIGSVHVRAWQAAYRGILPDEYLDGLSIPERRERWRRGLAEGPTDRSVLVVEDPRDATVCGFAVVGDPRDADGRGPGEGELWAINLGPEAWGRALGSALLDGAVGGLRARGAASAYLWVLERNQRARRFYDREGWSPDGGAKESRFGDRTVREVRYRRVLSSGPARD